MKQFHRTGQDQREEQREGYGDERDMPDIEEQADRAGNENAQGGDPARGRRGTEARPMGYLESLSFGDDLAATRLGSHAILFFSRPGKHVFILERPGLFE
jgi:hypothetical protein